MYLSYESAILLDIVTVIGLGSNGPRLGYLYRRADTTIFLSGYSAVYALAPPALLT